MSERAGVLVVGGGPAGLATSQQLKAHAIPHRVLERGDTVGYTWANLYDSLTLHTGKHMSTLPGRSFPRSAPLFVPRGEFWEYLRDYARAFALPVETQCTVERITRIDGTWSVTTSGGGGRGGPPAHGRRGGGPGSWPSRTRPGSPGRGGSAGGS